ncbi:MAG: hypothetical protein WCF56_09650 [Pseudolabrys sp.]
MFTFKFFPGQVFAGKVVSVLEATSTGPGPDLGRGRDAQIGHSGDLCSARQLDDDKLASSQPAGSSGDAAIRV